MGFAKDSDGERVWATSLESQYPKKMCVALVNVVLPVSATAWFGFEGPVNGGRHQPMNCWFSAFFSFDRPSFSGGVPGAVVQDVCRW